MAVIVSILGILIAVIGVAGLARPQSIVNLIQHWHSSARFWIALLVRAVLGVVLLAVAPECRWPAFVQVIGALSILAAAGLLVMGRARLDSLIAWWLDRSDLVRLAALLTVIFGIVLIYAGA